MPAQMCARQLEPLGPALTLQWQGLQVRKGRPIGRRWCAVWPAPIPTSGPAPIPTSGRPAHSQPCGCRFIETELDRGLDLLSLDLVRLARRSELAVERRHADSEYLSSLLLVPTYRLDYLFDVINLLAMQELLKLHGG